MASEISKAIHALCEEKNLSFWGTAQAELAVQILLSRPKMDQ
jgi:hypothetical protein